MSEWMNEWIDERINEWMNELTTEWKQTLEGMKIMGIIGFSRFWYSCDGKTIQHYGWTWPLLDEWRHT